MIDFSKMTIEEMDDLEDELLKVKVDAMKKENEEKNNITVGTYINNAGSLAIGDEDKGICLGSITEKGKAYILNSEERRENREKWRQTGFYLDHGGVQWRGKYYYINGDFCLVARDEEEEEDFNIYDFETCCPMEGVEDSNINMYKDCRTIILY